MSSQLDTFLTGLSRALAIGGPAVLLWPALLALGVYLVVTGQQLVLRPKPDLAERLRRMDVRALLRDADVHTRSISPNGRCSSRTEVATRDACDRIQNVRGGALYSRLPAHARSRITSRTPSAPCALA